MVQTLMQTALFTLGLSVKIFSVLPNFSNLKYVLRKIRKNTCYFYMPLAAPLSFLHFQSVTWLKDEELTSLLYYPVSSRFFPVGSSLHWDFQELIKVWIFPGIDKEVLFSAQNTKRILPETRSQTFEFSSCKMHTVNPLSWRIPRQSTLLSHGLSWG